MYFLFREKRWKPSEYHSMGEGEKRITHAFMIQEIEDIKKWKEENR